MHLELSYDPSSVEEAVKFFERRRYVVRAMVPEGYEAYFQDQARFVSAHTSTAIEGNPIGQQHAMMVLLEGPDHDDDDEVETLNTELAYEFVKQIASDPSLKIDQGLIRSLNSVLLRSLSGRAAQNRGKYRVGGSQIIDPTTHDVRYNPPPPEWVPGLMEDLESNLVDWLANDPPPVVAAKVHFAIISIHPFEDGNGRTARLLADLVLDHTGWSIDGMLSVNSILLNARQGYYDVLYETQGLDFVHEVEITPFVDFHTQALLRSATALEDKVVNFNIRKDSWINSLDDALNPRQVVGLMYMIDLGSLSTSTYARLNDCSQPTALSDLVELVGLGLVKRTGAGKSTRYSYDREDAPVETEEAISS